MWGHVGGTRQARFKHDLWGRLLSLAYGDAVGSENLFIQHTYLVVVAKAMAWAAMIDTALADATALLHIETRHAHRATVASTSTACVQSHRTPCFEHRVATPALWTPNARAPAPARRQATLLRGALRWGAARGTS